MGGYGFGQPTQIYLPQNRREEMASQFMSYWIPEQSALHDPEATLNHSASNQYKRCRVGDVLWIVTVRDGKLYLVGRFSIKHLVDHETACRLLDNDDLWAADLHAIGDPKGGDPIRPVSIHKIAHHLRFENKAGKETRILIENGKINGGSLQTMRRLKPDSIELLESARKNASD
jgi:hypothetical protein